MRFEFFQPSAELAPLIVGFYVFDTDEAELNGIERAGVGHIRFMFEGSGELRFANGNVRQSRAIMINGPGTGAINYTARGPCRTFGLALRPVGWYSLTGIPAHKCADDIRDGAEHFGEEIERLFAELGKMSVPTDMVASTEAFLKPRARPIADEHVLVCDIVGQWLADPGSPSIDALFARIPLSSRQVVRLVNQYYGAPPKVLERKIRALRAALALAKGVEARTVAEAFYDQSHMNREIRHFTGYTPGSFADMPDRILAESLNLSRIGELRPTQGA